MFSIALGSLSDSATHCVQTRNCQFFKQPVGWDAAKRNPGKRLKLRFHRVSAQPASTMRSNQENARMAQRQRSG